MTAVEGETDLWKADIDTAKYEKIIFVRVSGTGNIADYGAQTEDLTVPADKDLYTITSTSAQWSGEGHKVTGTWSVYKAQGGEVTPVTPAEKDSIYFVNVAGWAAPRVHLWGGTADGTEWPGVAMTKLADKINNYDVYKYVADKGAYAKCIFSDNGDSQTADLDWTSGKYFYNDGWYAKDAIPGPVVPAKFYITGDSALVVDAGAGKAKAWTADAIKSEKDTFTLSLKANQNYILKVVADGNWLGYDKLTEKAEGLQDLDGDNHNIGFKLAEAGEVKVVYFVKDKQVTFKLIGNFFVPETVMQIAGAWEVKDNAWVLNTMTNSTDKKTATYTVELKKGEYEFKVIKDGTWLTKANNGEAYGLHREWTGVAGVTDNATENLKLTADTEGEYTFVWTFANDSLGVLFPEKIIVPVKAENYIVHWDAEAENVIGNVNLYGGIVAATTKINTNTTNIDAINLNTSYNYTDGKYVVIKPARGKFLAGDTIEFATLINNDKADGSKYGAVYFYAADGATNIYKGKNGINGRTSNDVPLVEQFILEADQDSILLGRYGNTATYVSILNVARLGGEAALPCEDGPYAILVNGKDVEETVPGEEFDGYKQYVAYLSLTKGDSIQLINTSCGATWLPAIEKGGMSAHFKKGVNAATIDTTGCFDLYIKMKDGDDKLYIGAGICADDTVRYYIAGEGEGLGWDAEKRIAAKQDTTVLKLKAGDYKLKVVAGENWLGFEALTDTAAGLKDLDGDDHNIGFTLKEAGDVTIVYNDTVFTVTGKFYVRVPEYKDLYLVPGVWAEADAKIAAWIYTRKEGAEMADQWTAFFAPKAEGNDTLTAKIDSEADSILFVRFNKTVTAPTWENEAENVWNKMAADSIDYAGLTYTITDWAAGTWKKYEPILYYIAGEGEGLGWDAEKRIAAKQDTTVLNLKAGDYKLKVVAGEEWKGFEALTDTAAGLKADDDKNITFTLKEDAAVTIVYNDTVFTVTGNFYVRVPEYKDLYLVPGVWAEADAKIAAWIYTRKEGAEMADQWTAFFAPKAEGNDTLTAKIDAEADSILFVRFNKTVETPAWSDEEGVIWNKMEADTIDYAGLTYTITGWETGTWKVYVPEVPAKFYITGDSALVVNAGLNKEKAWAPDAIKVTEDSYTFENLAVGDYKLKVTDGAWSSEETSRMNLGFSDLTQEDKAGLTTDNDNNICFTLKEAGNVVVTCKKVEGVTTFTVTGKFYVPAEPQGCDWENIEFLGDGSPEQTFGNQFKVCKEGDVPGVVNIQKPGFAAETGIYVTFPSAAFGTISLAEGQYKIDGAGMVLYLSAFTAVETEVTVVCESKEYTFTVYNAKGSAPVVEHTYTVAGDSKAAFGTTWDPANTANDMTKQEDGTYKWEKEDVELLAGMLTFKVAEDHKWTVSYPADNYQLPIAETGKYNVTITFNPEGNVVNATATKTGEAVIIPTVAMHGNFTGSWVDTKNFTVAEDNETATLTMNLTVGNYEFGMRIGGPANWTANGVAFTLENTSAVVVAGSGNLTLAANIEGEYTFTWTYATSTLSIKFPEGEIVEPTLDNGYYVIGLNGWDVADLTADDMFWSTGIETGEYSLNVTLAVGNEFKVVYVKDDKIETWFPEGDNYVVDANHAGAKTIYFRPGYNGNDDWYAKCIYVAPNSDTPTGINAINADAKAVKVLRNGQLLIIKGEKTYNGLGTLVR